jgi:Mlc titration factor MtfA (ptsG expression regulator)
MSNKEFVPMKMNEVTDEMRVLISATAVQLTFGLRTLRLPVFPKILVFPKKFLNKITGNVHIGEVNTRGIIALSWEDFKKGFANETDGRNVGLHELAHAIQFEDAVDNDEHGFLSVEQLKKINMYYEIEKLNAKNGEQSFFRDYALTNSAEFFAVGVEYFFEKSVEFRSVRPELYTVYMKLLNQDPIRLQAKS